MLNWLLGRRRRKRRELFWYELAGRPYSFDPVLVSIRLAEDPEYLPRHIDDALGGDVESMEVVARAASHAFGVRRATPDGEGVSMTDLLELLVAFHDWSRALKKNTSHSLC